ncbi:MAG: FAD-binding protein, partial [Gammaproteobacteria bacterium]|nr:FAD-binding protein [Gammaproteobacteria bacterium]
MPVMHSLPRRVRAQTLDRRQFLGAAASVAALLPARTLWAEASGPGAVPAELAAVSVDGKSIVLTAAEVKELQTALGGRLLLAQDAGYDQARRVWNGSIDRHPALIARCTSAADIVHAVQFASAHSLLTAVKGGGHSISGQSTCEGGLMIDLTSMRDIHVDRNQRLARAQSGVLLAELDGKCQAAGLVTPLGTAADTGIAGLTLGGGQGRLMRKLGLSCDNVRSFELVTADGKIRKVSAKEHPDLYWALRGGGGNFGVVSGFEYRLHPLDHPVLAGGRMYPFDQARSIIKGVIDMAA